MNATIQKWGNSQGIRIPKVILDESGFSENDVIEITTENECIILKRAVKPKHITVEKRLEAFFGKPINQIELLESYDETDTGKPLGEEIW